MLNQDKGHPVLMEVKNLDAGYGFLHILRDVCIQVDKEPFAMICGIRSRKGKISE
jgi:hypothetical protein